MNNLLKSNILDCTGCSLCEFLCPTKSITVTENKRGFFKRNINTSKCIECGLCLKSCPSLINFAKTKMNIYGGYAKENEIVENSRSGGLFYLLASNVINNGGVAIGSAFVDNFKVKHILVDNIDDLWKLQGSKYVQSDFKDVFNYILSAYKDNKTIIVGGLSCQIAAVKMFIDFKKLDKSKIILVDILCYGVPSRKIFREYIDTYKNDGLLYFDFRDKSFGWERHVESAYTIKRGKLSSNKFSHMFSSKLIISDNCFNCKYKTSDRIGDISLGDFWNVDKFNSNLSSKLGNSLIFVNSDIGKTLLESIKSDLVLFDVDSNLDFWKQPAVNGNFEKPTIYEQFWVYYEKNKFKKTYDKYFKEKTFSRLKRFTKKVFKRLLKRK